MNTDALVEALAKGPIAVGPRAVERRLGAALAGGATLATLAMLAALGLRPDLHAALREPMFWAKLAYPLVLSLAAACATTVLARPAGRARRAAAASCAVAAAMVLAALGILAIAPAGGRVALAVGHSALACVVAVAALSLPVFALAVVALRRCAPTRLRSAGAAAGLLAGATAAAVYAWHCDETALPFLGLWYTLGMVMPAAIGAVLGPRLLRWA
ncbi:MAG TPA: DUF1109 domain-containing protein [Caldimonas sp.]|nr:DUF1109 domain-containing protein [Caldimonas sp.]